MNLPSVVVVGTSSIDVAYSSSSFEPLSLLIGSSSSNSCIYLSNLCCFVLAPDCHELLFELRNLCVSLLDGGESVFYFDFQLISMIFYAVGNSLVVLPDCSKVVEEGLGVTNVTGTFLLKIFDEDEDQGEGAVDDVDGEVGEEDQYPKKY